MAKNIRGIVIEIEGKTSGLVDSLKKANSTIAATQSSLRKVEQALKLDPTNVEALQQKQSLLNREIEATKQRLEVEKQAALDAARALEEGTGNPETYAQLQADITLTSAKLADLESQSDITGAQLDALADGSATTAEDLKKIADGATDAGNGIKDGFGNESAASITSLHDKMESFAQGLGAIGGAIEQNLTEPLKKATETALEAFGEVDAGSDIIATKTGATGAALEEMQGIANDLATTLPVSFEQAGEAVGEVNTRLGATGEELSTLSSDFLKFAQINNTDVSSAVENTQRVLAAYNIEIGDTGALLDTLNATGQSSGITMDELTTQLANNVETFNQLGMSVSDAAAFLGEVNLSGADTSAVMTGLRNALKNATAEGVPVSEMLADLEKNLTSTDETAEGTAAAFELFGSRAAPQLANAIRNGTISFDDFSSSLEDNAGSVQTTFESTQDATDELTLAQNKLKIAEAELGDSVAESLAPAMSDFADAITKVVDAFESLPEEDQQNLIKSLAALAGVGAITSKLATFGSQIVSVAAGLKMLGIGGAASGAATGTASVGTAATGAGAALSGFGVVIGPVIAALALAGIAADDVRDKWDAWTWAFEDDNVKMSDAFAGGFGSIPEALGAKTQEIAESLGVNTEDVGNWVLDNEAKFTEFKDNMSGAVENIKTNWSEGWENVKETFATKWEEIKTGAGAKWENFKTDLDTLRQEIEDKFTNFDALKWGKDLIKGFIDGIKAKWDDLKGTLNRTAQQIKDYLGFSEPEKGPLSNAHTYGPDFVDLYASGIKNSLPELTSATQEMANTLAGANPNATTQNYTGLLQGISGQLSGLAVAGAQSGTYLQPINIYLGSNKLGTAVAEVTAQDTFRRGR